MEPRQLPSLLPRTETPPRPGRLDQSIRRAAAARSVPALRQWLAKEADGITDDDLINDLACVLTCHDGYERARRFERLGYEPDAELVELLGDMDTWRDHQAALEAWVKANSITAEFSVGDRVFCSKDIQPGKIASVDADHGHYTVLLDEDRPKRAKGHIGTIFDFEAVVADTRLWCCHIKGPDDVMACDDQDHAERVAKTINEGAGRLAAQHDILFEAGAAEWPHSAEAHARDLADPSKDYAPILKVTRWSRAVRDIHEERERQVAVEGWSDRHDDEHDDGSLLQAAVLYHLHATGCKEGNYRAAVEPTGWPWEPKWWKPKDPRRDLVRAGALCMAERERLQRAGEQHGHVDHEYDLIVAALEAINTAAVVDRAQRTLVDGYPVTEDHRELQPNGQQKGYVVLSAEERAKGFQRPVRRSYVHQTCGTSTTMAQAIAETYARDPGFYSGTFCSHCKDHFPVGGEGQFVWTGTDEKVGT